jgi:hypothetical protein
MSPDDPKQDDGDPAPQRAGGPRPKAPQARPPEVDRDKLPKPRAETTTPMTSTSTPSLPKHWRSGVVAVVAVVAIIALIASNSGGSPSPTTSVVVPAPPGPGVVAGNPGETNPTVTTPPPPPTPPSIVYSRDITVVRSQSFDLDKPGLRNLPNGFDVGFVSEQGDYNLNVVGAGSVAEWTGSGEPHYSQCASTASSGGQTVHLETGHWICAETASKLIVRLRYNGSSGQSVHLAVTVYKPGTG